MKMKKINYNEVIKRLEVLKNEKDNAKFVLISSGEKETDGLYHLTQTDGKNSKMMTFESLEKLEKYVNRIKENYQCIIIWGTPED